MAINELKEKLSKLRLGPGRKRIPENIWFDVVRAAQKIGVGKVAKELNLNTSRVRHWAAVFKLNLPPKITKKQKRIEKVIKVAPVNLQTILKKNAPEPGNQKVLEICSRNGLSFSLFEASSEQHVQFLIKLAGGAL